MGQSIPLQIQIAIGQPARLLRARGQTEIGFLRRLVALFIIATRARGHHIGPIVAAAFA